MSFTDDKKNKNTAQEREVLRHKIHELELRLRESSDKTDRLIEQVSNLSRANERLANANEKLSDNNQKLTDSNRALVKQNQSQSVANSGRQFDSQNGPAQQVPDDSSNRIH